MFQMRVLLIAIIRLGRSRRAIRAQIPQSIEVARYIDPADIVGVCIMSLRQW